MTLHIPSPHQEADDKNDESDGQNAAENDQRYQSMGDLQI